MNSSSYITNAKSPVSVQFRQAFDELLRDIDAGRDLKQAAMTGSMGEWTMALTNLVARCCDQMDWSCSARWNPNQVLPWGKKEFLTLDLTAFPNNRSGWQFPVAAIELENMASKRKIAYCLWKLLCVKSRFRCLFCYRDKDHQVHSLLGHLQREVICNLSPREREGVEGETILCVGTRSDAATFPFGFFKWWSLNMNTTRFNVI